MKKILLAILVIFLGMPINSYAQQEASIAKNSIYGTVGVIGLGGFINLNYERNLMQSEGFFKQYNMRIGGGYWSVIGSSGVHTPLNFVALTGQKNNHFEFMAGAIVTYDNLSYGIKVNNATALGEPIPTRFDSVGLLPSISVGYRYQKPTGGFLFRVGASFPEGGYIGLGCGF